jgi:hypothetical protein
MNAEQSWAVGQDGILRRTVSPARRVANPPQAASLPHNGINL